MKIKIAYIETFPEIGGGQNGLIDFVTYMNKDLFDLTVVVPSLDCKLAKALKNAVPDLKLEPLKFDYVPFGYDRRAFFPIINPIGSYKLKKLLEKIKPDVLHANQIFAGKYSLPVAKKLGIPCLQTMRNVYLSKKFNLNKFVDSRVSKNANYIVFNTETGATIFRDRVKTDNVITVLNAINLEKYEKEYDNLDEIKDKYGIPKDKRILIACGTLSWSKGHYLLLEVFAELIKKFDDLHLLIVGEEFANTNERENLQKLTEKFEIEDKVSFPGRISDMAPMYKMSYCHVLTSLVGESVPRVIMESNACGIPSLGSNISGIHEAIEHGENGYLVKVGNKEDWINKLTDILNLSKEDYCKMQERALEIAKERSDVRRLIKSYEDLYISLAKIKSL